MPRAGISCNELDDCPLDRAANQCHDNRGDEACPYVKTAKVTKKGPLMLIVWNKQEDEVTLVHTKAAAQRYIKHEIEEYYPEDDDGDEDDGFGMKNYAIFDITKCKPVKFKAKVTIVPA